MASMATTLSASHTLASVAGLVSKPTVSRRSGNGAVLVVSAADGSQPALSRRQVAVSLAAISVSVAAISVALNSSSQQQRQSVARNVPIFGLKKAKLISEEVVKDLVNEGKELVKEGKGAISGLPSFPAPGGGEGSLSPELQAGVVAGAGLVGVLVASTVVNSLVSPSK